MDRFTLMDTCSLMPSTYRHGHLSHTIDKLINFITFKQAIAFDQILEKG